MAHLLENGGLNIYDVLLFFISSEALSSAYSVIKQTINAYDNADLSLVKICIEMGERMFTAAEIIPDYELKSRQAHCQKLLQQRMPEAGGILIFSRLAIYYLTGTFASGVLWLPTEGTPVLGVRKGVERAALESPGLDAGLYHSFSELPKLLESFGSPLSKTLAVEQNALSWGLGQNLAKSLASYTLLSGDHILQRLRSVKSSWELDKLRIAGQRHYKSLCQLLPERLKYNQSEYDISCTIWEIFFSLGHHGAARMSAPGEEMFQGYVSVGKNSIYPTYYNGPLGAKGIHPSASFMGYAGSVLSPDSFLAVDVGFVLEGYNTDKTQLYFAGKKGTLPSEAQKAQECAMLIQTEIASRLKPGAIPQELYQLSIELAEKAGFAEGYMGYAGNKVPFLGHGIGLAVDEWPVLANRFLEPLQAGMVLALEPKITIPDYGMLGVENTFIVTEHGGECLTTGSADLFDDAGDIIYLE